MTIFLMVLTLMKKPADNAISGLSYPLFSLSGFNVYFYCPAWNYPLSAYLSYDCFHFRICNAYHNLIPSFLYQKKDCLMQSFLQCVVPYSVFYSYYISTDHAVLQCGMP